MNSARDSFHEMKEFACFCVFWLLLFAIGIGVYAIFVKGWLQ